MGLTQSVPPSLTALGRRSLPDRIELAGDAYALERVFKNDFFAITAAYVRSPDGGAVDADGFVTLAPGVCPDDLPERLILKVGRQARFLLLPLGWVGRLLESRERAIFGQLDGLVGVPRLLGRWQRTGLVREYVEGTVMAKGTPVPDDFHARLRQLVGDVHGRGVAVVDLEKCENVLVGADGVPFLFDFQISWHISARWGGELAPARWIRKRLQAADLYHLVKLQRRTRPDQMSPEALQASYLKPWYVRLHTKITRPMTLLRRIILDRVAPRRVSGERGRTDQS